MDREPAVQQVLRARDDGRRHRERRGGHDPGARRCSTTSGASTRSGSSARMADDERPWFLYHCTRGTHFDNYPHPKFLGKSPAKHPYKDTIIELDDIVGRLVADARGDRPARRHARVHHVRQRAGDGDVARHRVLAVPQREGLHVGGRPAGAGHRLLAGDDRARPGDRRPVLADGLVPDDAAPRRRIRHDSRRPLHRRRSTRRRSCSATTRRRTASSSTTGSATRSRRCGWGSTR